MILLQIGSLAVGYGARKVLTDISLTVCAGEFVGIVAPNGTGKSTLLKTIAGVLPPLRGDITLKGKQLYGYKRRELAKHIAVVGAEVAAFDYIAHQMVYMGRFAHIPRFRGPNADDYSIVQSAMEDVGIWHKQLCPCSQLSQGEMQKVIIARALAQQPELLLLDEPTAHLDVANQYGIMRLIKHLAKRKNMAVIAVLHDINLAIEFSSHLMFLKDGRILDYGEPRSVISKKLLKELYGMDFTLHNDATGIYVRPQST